MPQYRLQLAWVVCALTAILCAPVAQAGKVEDVKKVVKDTCKKDIPEDELMDAVIAAFDCMPGSEVKIVDCTIKCLKENKGTVVGK